MKRRNCLLCCHTCGEPSPSCFYPHRMQGGWLRCRLQRPRIPVESPLLDGGPRSGGGRDLPQLDQQQAPGEGSGHPAVSETRSETGPAPVFCPRRRSCLARRSGSVLDRQYAAFPMSFVCARSFPKPTVHQRYIQVDPFYHREKIRPRCIMGSVVGRILLETAAYRG